MSQTHPWPPLEVVRRGLDSGDAQAPGPAEDCGTHTPTGSTGADAPSSHADYLLLPLTELARRRAAVAARQFPATLAAGRLVRITRAGSSYGMLLDHQVGPHAWTGWMAAAEADWAGPFDVLLEPVDDPFEPMFGLIQTWNQLQVDLQHYPPVEVVGEVSAVRLAAIRAVAQEADAATPPALTAEPGRIALRTVAGTFLVLTGTPMAPGDERLEYQHLYRTAALQLAGPAQPAPQKVAGDAAGRKARPGWWAGARRWLAADGLVRPAFALLALVFVAQNLLLQGGGADDAVRFRSAPAVDAPAQGRIAVRWKPGVGMDAVQALLHASHAQIVAGPDAQGRYAIASADLAATARLLQQSALVASVEQP